MAHSLESIIAVIFVILYYFYVATEMDMDLFKNHGAFKILFIVLGFWLTLVPLNVAMLHESGTAHVDVISNLGIVYNAAIAINILVTIYFIIWFIVNLIRKMQGYKA